MCSVTHYPPNFSSFSLSLSLSLSFWLQMDKYEVGRTVDDNTEHVHHIRFIPLKKIC
jgi:hypothetical protein